MELMTIVVMGLLTSAATVFFVHRFLKGRRSNSQTPIIGQTSHSSIDELRSVGELTVYRAFTKEIVTQTDHSWGEFGAKYLSWVLSKKKMAMIFEFEITFLYNLMDSDFVIEAQENPGHYLLKMPKAKHDVKIKGIQFYDEQDARILPWLLPDLVNKAFVGVFSQQDKNTLLEAARSHASQQAVALIERLRPEVESSAKNTLFSIAKSFGAEKVTFAFDHEKLTRVDVKLLQDNLDSKNHATSKEAI